MREATVLTPKGVASRTTFLDWETQPSPFKHYPSFCHRIALENHPTLGWIGEIRTLTHTQKIFNKPYYRLNVPSAGNLHPIELYVQLRNVSGVLSGIYHLDTHANSLVLIEEIASEGLEPYVGLENRLYGALLFFTLVPFRSGWKYGMRGGRYLYLDLGHAVGGLMGVAHHYGKDFYPVTPQEPSVLNGRLGMGEEEYVAAVYAIGTLSDKTVQPLASPVMRVSPCDYTLENEPLHAWVASQKLYTSLHPHYGKWWTKQSNSTRRSSREFSPKAFGETILTTLLQMHSDTLEIIPIVLVAQTHPCGVYRAGVCCEEGNFTAEIVHLLLDQRFIARANVVILLFAQNFTAHAHSDAGVFAHELYSFGEHHGIGCSGIGAFYDELAVRWSPRPLLYAVALGEK